MCFAHAHNTWPDPATPRSSACTSERRIGTQPGGATVGGEFESTAADDAHGTDGVAGLAPRLAKRLASAQKSRHAEGDMTGEMLSVVNLAAPNRLPCRMLYWML